VVRDSDADRCRAAGQDGGQPSVGRCGRTRVRPPGQKRSASVRAAGDRTPTLAACRCRRREDDRFVERPILAANSRAAVMRGRATPTRKRVGWHRHQAPAVIPRCRRGHDSARRPYQPHPRRRLDPRGTPSTVVDCSGPEPRILRAGAISTEAIEAASPEIGRPTRSWRAWTGDFGALGPFSRRNNVRIGKRARLTIVTFSTRPVLRST